jgi:hypothetical protein
MAGLLDAGGRLRRLCISLNRRQPGQSAFGSSLGVLSVIAGGLFIGTIISGIVLLVAGSWPVRLRLDVAGTLWLITGVTWMVVMAGFDRALRSVS